VHRPFGIATSVRSFGRGCAARVHWDARYTRLGVFLDSRVLHSRDLDLQTPSEMVVTRLRMVVRRNHGRDMGTPFPGVPSSTYCEIGARLRGFLSDNLLAMHV
jgi:hypothetical protein